MKKAIGLSTCFALAVALSAQAQETGQSRQQNQLRNQQQRQLQQQPQQQQQRQERQQRGVRPGERTQTQQGETVQSGDELNQLIASCLQLANHEEIAISQIAMEKSQNEKVKQFAQKMMQDHQQLAQKLQKFSSRDVSLQGAEMVGKTGGRSGIASRTEQSQPGQTQPGTATPADATDRVQQRAAYRGGTNSLGEKVFQLQKDAAEECLKITKQNLNEAQGDKFDEAFLGCQIGMHIAMLGKLKAAGQHSSGELQQVIQSGEQATQQHLEDAKRLMKELTAGGQGAGTEAETRRPSLNN